MSDKYAHIEKVRDLNALLARNTALTTAEYIQLLQEVKKNFLVHMVGASLTGKLKNTGAWMHIIDRCHWLLDSAETKMKQETGFRSSQKRGLEWEYPEKEVEAEA